MNPFKYGQVVSSKDFCPRPVLTDQLKTFIESGQNVVVQGERRMGKTSLIHEAVGELKGYRMLYIDLMEIKTTEGLCKRIISALISLEQRSGFWKKILSSLSQLRPVISLDPVTNQPTLSIDAGIKLRPESIEGLLDLIQEVKDRKQLAVVFDEFQGMLNLPQAHEILAVMRGKIQFHSDIPYVFAGSIRSQMSDIFKISLMFLPEAFGVR
jgi:AAA+ ATPase superfamily predicted ATPase